MFPNTLELQKLISPKFNKKTLFYISVGCSSNLNLKKINKLLESDMHQLPPFIEKLYSKNKFNLVLFLIDELLNDEPYVVSYLSKKYKLGFFKDKNIFVSNDHKIIIYNQKINISYGNDLYGQDIIPFLKTVNWVVSKYLNTFLFFHDFSGFDVSLLAWMFESTFINNSLNRIIYDLSHWNNEGCMINLNKYEFQYDDISFRNPFNHLQKPISNYEKESMKVSQKKKLLKTFEILLPIYRGLLINNINNDQLKKYLSIFSYHQYFIESKLKIDFSKLSSEELQKIILNYLLLVSKDNIIKKEINENIKLFLLDKKLVYNVMPIIEKIDI